MQQDRSDVTACADSDRCPSMLPGPGRSTVRRREVYRKIPPSVGCVVLQSPVHGARGGGIFLTFIVSPLWNIASALRALTPTVRLPSSCRTSRHAA